MKKLLSILTVTSFSLVPTINIIACQNKAENDDEVVGETISQEIVDGAVDEINESRLFQDRIYMDGYIEDSDIKKIVLNIDKKPEFIMMMHILQAVDELSEETSFKDSNIFKLSLNLDKTEGIGLHILLKNNLEKFKVVLNNINWFEDVKTVFGSKESDYKEYKFKLKFGKTLSTNSVKIKLFWSDKKI